MKTERQNRHVVVGISRAAMLRLAFSQSRDDFID
jgi:hypothetical protein